MKLIKSIFSMLVMLSAFNLFAQTPLKEVTLTKDNAVVLRTDFNSQSVNEIKLKLTTMNAELKSGYPIYLVLDTPGGSIQAGLELFEFVKGLNRPVHTITIFAASMGFQTVQHLGERLILEYGVLMSHKARGGFTGEFGGSEYSQLDSRYSLWKKRVLMMDMKTVERTNGKQTLQSYTQSYAPELWLNGPEAVELGYADAVVKASCSTELSNSRERIDLDFGFIIIEAIFSQCPLFTFPVDYRIKFLTNRGTMEFEEFIKNGGKFGKECSAAREEEKNWEGKLIREGREEGLCAYDKELTIQKLNSKLDEVKSEYTKSSRDRVKYSY